MDTSFEITYACNLRCRHCYQDRADHDNLLSLAEINDIMDQIVDIGGINVALTGGEIFLRKDILDIIEHGVRSKLAIQLFTNGILLDEHICRELKKLKISRVEISLHSLNEQAFDDFTQVEGSFQQLMINLETLKRHGIPFLVKTPITEANVHELEDIERFAKERGIELKYSPFIIPTLSGQSHPTSFRIGKQEMDLVIKKDIDKKGLNLREVDLTKKDVLPQCGAGTRIVHIDPYGNVYPCIISNKVLGSLKNESLRDIWYESDAVKAFRKWIPNAIPEPCHACEKNSICSRCVALGEIEATDSMGLPLEICRIADSIYNAITESVGGEEIYFSERR